MVDIITIRPAENETLDSITTQLIEYETSNALRKDQEGIPDVNISEGQALVGAEHNSNQGKQQSGRGRRIRRGQGKGRSHRNKPYNLKTGGKCFYCLKQGHKEKECFFKQKVENFRRETTGTKIISGNHVESEDPSSDTVIHGFAAFSEASTGTWIIDSGASHHLTGNRQAFRVFQFLAKPIPIKVANRTNCLAMGSGSIDFQLNCGLLLTVNPLYIPDFGTVSLLSVNALNNSGYEVLFRSGTCIVSSDSLEQQCIGKRQAGCRTCTLLGFVLAEAQANCAISDSKIPEDLNIWHRRFAHMNLADLHQLLPRQVFKERSPESICRICAMAKAKQQFQRTTSATRAKKPLELIHSDLCGPILPISPSGCQYYILYIDDYSRLSWVYFLRIKTSAEICTVFREFKVMLELKFQPHRITRFRSDNGRGEYNNIEFLSILKESGISFEPAPPYTPHKNGISKRMIQTHNMKARAMMLDCQLPSILWAEAINTANYLHAQSPTAANKGMTPYQKLYGRKPEVSHLRRFGCSAYRLLPASQRRGKFTACVEVVYMVGYVHDSTTLWRLWDADRKHVILASNVRFDEFAKGHEPANMRLDPFDFEKPAANASRQDDASRQGNPVALSTPEDANVADVNAIEASRQVDSDASRQDDAGRQVDADMRWCYDTASYNLRKRP